MVAGIRRQEFGLQPIGAYAPVGSWNAACDELSRVEGGIKKERIQI